MRPFKAIALVLLVTLLFQACRKDLIPVPDSQHDLLLEKIESAKATLSVKEKPFFEPDFAEYNNPHVEQKLGFRTNPDSLVTEVLETVLLQNKEEQFVTDLIDNLGYPFWSRGEVFPVVNDPTHNLTAIPMARLDEDFTSAILFSVIGAQAPYFFLVEREELLTFLDVVKVQNKENARFLVAEMLRFDFEIFGTQDSLLYTGLDDLENNVLDKDEKLSFRCGTIEVEYNKCIPVYAFHSDPSGSLELRSCPPGTEEVTITLTAAIPCNTPDLSFPVDDSSTFPGGNTDWWTSAGSGSHGNTSSSTQPILNATLNGLNVSTLQDFFDACNAQGEPGIPIIPGGLCDQIEAVLGIIPAGSAELAWLLGDGAINQDLLNFFANWAPTHDLPANAEFAAGIIQLYTTGKIDASKGFNVFDFTRAANLMAQLGLSFEQAVNLYNFPQVAVAINNFLNAHGLNEITIAAAISFNDLSIAQQNTLGLQTILDFISLSSDFLDDPAAHQDQIYDFLIGNNINPLSFDADDLSIPTEDILAEEDAPIYQDLTPARVWEIAGPIKSNLVALHPDKTDKIDGLFVCRVLGMGFESAVLESLGIDKYNKALDSNSGNYSIPDGLKWVPGYDHGLVQSPLIIEVKGVFSTTDPNFNYSQNMPQLTNYLNFLQAKGHRSYESALHGLYLVVPGGVSVSNNIANLASNQNIPLHVSNVKLVNNDPEKFQVKRPTWTNADNINKKAHLFWWMGNWIFTKEFHQRYFKYKKVSFLEHLQNAAAVFESDYLIGNQEGCPSDE